MADKKVTRAFNPPVPAGQVVDWIGYPPLDAGVLPLEADGFKGSHFTELLKQHGDAVLPSHPVVGGIHKVVGHGEQGEVHKVENDTDVNFNEIVHDFGETIQGFRTEGDTIIVWGNNGKVWGSTDGGNNFTLLPAYLNSGSPGSQRIHDLQFGNGVWLVSFDDFFAICRADILIPANWVALPINLGGLTNGPTNAKNKMATDGNGNWLVGGSWHQFAWTNDDWVTINLDPQPNGSNGASQKVPFPQLTNYSSYTFCWCSDDGVFFAGSERQNVIYRSDDGLATWTAITDKFNTGVTVDTSNPQSMIDLGNGHYMVMYNNQYCAETFDMGLTWVRRASYLGFVGGIYTFASDKKGMFLVTNINGSVRVHTSKNDGQTFVVDVAQSISTYVPILHWRDAWYGINATTLVRSLNGYVRTEWELKP